MSQVRQDRSTDAELAVPDRTTAGPTSSLDPRRIVVWSLGAFVALRCCVVLAADTPSVTPDEFGAWAIARFLTGQDELISMRDMPRYPLLSGLALSPLSWLGLDPVSSYRSALVLLSAMTVAAAAIVRRAVALVSPGRPELAAAAFAMVLLFPATFVSGSFTWAEPTVVLWWAALLWSTARLAWSPTSRTTALGSLVAGLAPFAHGRLSAVPLVWIVALVARHVVEHRSGARGAALRAAFGVAMTLGTAAVARLLDQAVERAVWTDAGGSVGSSSPSIATGPWWKGLGTALIGQGWYLLAATVGLGLVGAVHLAMRAHRPDRDGTRLFALTFAAMLASNLAISVGVTAGGLAVLFGGPRAGIGGTRWDHLVYGRYNDGAALMLAVAGLVMCWEWAGRRLPGRVLAAAAALTIVSAGSLSSIHGEREFEDALNLTIGGVSAFGGGAGLHLLRWTAVAVLVMVGLAIAQRRGTTAFAAVAGTWLVVGALGAAALTVSRHHERSQPELATLVGAPEVTSDHIVVARDAEHLPAMRLGIFAQQRDLTDLGWTFDFDPDDSDALAAEWRDEWPATGALVLVEGVRPDGDGWSAAATHRGVTFWRR